MKTPLQMRKILRFYCKKAGSQSEAGRRLKVSRFHISNMLSGRREISERVAAKLGYRRIVFYQEAK